jgi:glycosyltransferase involved in cell wall biosynthesis
MIRISIITPSFNQANFLEQTIQSIISQRYDNLQYIIIDGGSTDGSVDIIKKYEQYLDHWISEPDGGQSNAINKGLKRCNGDVVNWINSDDLLAQGSLSYVASVFEGRNIDILGGSYVLFRNGDIDSGQTISYNPLGTLSNSIANVLMHQPSTFFRTKTILDLGMLNSSLKYIMDQDLWIRYLMKYGHEKITISERILAYFRLHERSLTYNHGTSDFWNELDSYFYSLAIGNGLNKQAVALKRRNPAIYSINLNPSTGSVNPHLLSNALNNQFEKRILQDIHDGNKDLAVRSLQGITNGFKILFLYFRIKADPFVRIIKRNFRKR